jgi:hypothetical protein
MGRHGLIWIGEKFYDMPEAFMREATMMGVSRKISAVPRGFRLGETVVYLGHRKAAFAGWECDAHGANPEPERCCDQAKARMEPGVFTVFRPRGIDLVVEDADDVPDRATRLAERIEDEGAAGAVRIVQVTPERQEDFPQTDEQPQPEATP